MLAAAREFRGEAAREVSSMPLGGPDRCGNKLPSGPSWRDALSASNQGPEGRRIADRTIARK